MPQPAKKAGFLNHVLDAMIEEDLLQLAAEDDKFLISDKTTAAEIQKIPVFQDDAKVFDRERFHRILAANGISEAGFITYLRIQTASKLLGDAELGGIKPPQALIDAQHRFESEQRQGETIHIDIAGMAVPAATPAQLDDFYHQHAIDYTAPEYRTLSFITLGIPDVAQTITVSPEELQQAYEARAGEFQTPERRDLQQLIVQDEAKAQGDRHGRQKRQDLAGSRPCQRADQG